ncbi:SusC/RagA family TonB-linked outer membrane protein [Chitinophaga caeni]|uniref:SusC/RagA family TonB-linked outer membrane protein n=1 Tax=Chitinophaga caeni TaxID=2029983 RepID=A0A291QV18_9BACT|nr:TonB-dependent receptor [Chitinophaga caeni]ATL47786.1 SusC/RagA family TonB-linked outer membrane protein [Chitinophaga caeni]
MFKMLQLFRKSFLLSLLLFSFAAMAQQSSGTITGVVTDEEGGPMPFVSITVKNSISKKVYQALSDTAGHFKFSNMPTEGTYSFEFSSTGYVKRSITGYVVKSGVPNSVVVSLAIDQSDLDEVVVVGYGTQKKVNLTGAVNQISGDEIRDRPATNITSMLQGVMPNLNIRVASGTPGQMASLNIRGVTSIDGNSAVSGAPLVLIDGIPGTLDRLSPEEIQSISVLKDASSAAIYGARGAFGVILVTTKNGKSGKMSLRYNNSFGFSTPTVSTDFITTGYDWMKLNDAALAHIGGYSGYTEQDYQELLARRNDKTEDPSRPWVTIQNRNGRDQYVYYGNYDWWDIMFTKWQPMQNHNISLMGGNDKINFMINGNLKSKDGIMRLHTDKYSSKTLRAKFSAQMTPWLKFSNNTNFYNSSYKYYGREGGGSANFIHINVHASPAYAPMNPDGTATYITGLNNYDIGDGIFAMLIDGHTRGQDRKYELTTINEVTISPVKNLNIRGNYSYSLYTDPSYYRQAPAKYSLYPGVIDITPKYSIDQLSEEQQFNQVHVANLYMDYAKTFNKVHNIKALLGYNQELHLAKKITAQRMDLASEDLNDLNLGSGEQKVFGGSSEYALMGLFYRLNYDYKGKYLLELNGRYDGTSKFPKDNRWGFFPSVSAAWRISEEDFFNPIRNVFSDLKIRGSYGSLGNQNVSGYYPYIPTMNPGTMAYMLDGERAKYYNSPAPVSGDLTWETITSYNLGVDAAFLNNRLGISFDTYIRNTEDMLSQGLVLPNVYGSTPPEINIASLRTQGFELSINWRDMISVAGKPFQYHAAFILSDNHTKITKVQNTTRLTYSMYEGKEVGEIWGYITDGFFQTDAEAKTYPVDQTWLNRVRNDNNIPIQAGDLRWIDLDGDGKISAGENTVSDPGDQKVIGNSTPRYQYAFNLGANWNNIDFSVFFQGLGKMNWYPGNNADRFWGPYSRPYFSFIPKDFEKDIYSETNKNAYFPNLLAYVALNANNELRATNNRYLQNLAYLRLKNLTIGYTLPKSLLDRYKIQRLRIFASGENLWTWTKLRTDYIDPEQAMSNNDGRVYPFSKTFSFGLDVSF